MAQNIYVINGFYMAMREKYTKPSASITYFVVEWDSASLSWSDFRGKVLGATDPTTAEVGSLRRIILEQYKELGLQSIPNVGDNGVHASASPFEGLAERLNWVGAKLETDPFGKALLELGIHPSTILEWTKDPQVEYQGKKGSLFDLLEDKNSNEVLEIAKGVASVSGSSSPTKNIAFVFVKPHAQTPAVASLVKEKFAQSGISVLLEGTLDGQTIESNLLIDNHYYAIANKASLTKPKDLNPPATKQAEFEQTFGLTWAEALNRGIVFNAVDACKVLGVDGEQMDSIWGKAKKDGKLVKFGGGFYCGQLPGPQPKPSNQNLYVINGFYMAMREKYTKPGASISYFLAEWDPAVLSWADFRGRVLGATDPTTAVEGSLRRIILEQYKELGLTSQPNVGDNGVHASASPFEGLAERLNWVGAKLETDPFGQALLAAGISPATILEWTKDPQVEFEGKKGSLFDLMEDLNSGDVLEKAKVVAKSSGSVGPAKNAAFIFVKPHAVTPAVVSLVRSKLVENGLTITQEGSLDSQVIEANLLIDNHYYAIANKASLTKPKDLNPPASKQEEFAKTFGITWAEALAKGLVFNAVDACKLLGVNGDQMDDIWAKAKKANQLVKFGGGFYCGRLQL